VSGASPGGLSACLSGQPGGSPIRTWLFWVFWVEDPATSQDKALMAAGPIDGPLPHFGGAFFA